MSIVDVGASSDAHSRDEKAADALRFDCPQCGSRLEFDAALGMLTCNACGFAQRVEAEAQQSTIVEYDLEQGLATAPDLGLGLPTRTTSCQSCGAIISFGATETAGSCTFCGSSHVLEIDSHRQTIRPESLVPFSKSKSVAQDHFKTWIHSLWFRPSNLKKLASITQIQGVYIPYWVFDATVDSQWHAMAGYHYYVTETYTQTVNGVSSQATRQVQKTRWMPARGSRRDVYDDFLVCASKGLPGELAIRLNSFNTKQLVTYEPSYLAGWKAEEYQLELKPAWQQAIHRLESEQTNRCGSDVPGDTFMGLSVANQFSETRFKHVLLPIWIAAYRYRDKSFQFLVNGQTGEVEGKAPFSFWKITFAVIAGLFVMLMILMIYTSSGNQRY